MRSCLNAHPNHLTRWIQSDAYRMRIKSHVNATDPDRMRIWCASRCPCERAFTLCLCSNAFKFVGVLITAVLFCVPTFAQQGSHVHCMFFGHLHLCMIQDSCTCNCDWVESLCRGKCLLKDIVNSMVIPIIEAFCLKLASQSDGRANVVSWVSWWHWNGTYFNSSIAWAWCFQHPNNLIVEFLYIMNSVWPGEDFFQ